jgi:hypothetical protein
VIRSVVAGLLLIAAYGCSIGASVGTGPHVNPALRDQLLTLGERDARVRATPGDPERGQTDAANLATLRGIVDQYGWPDRNVVGTDAADAAVTLVLHADADPAFQRKCLGLIQARGAVPPISVAYLTDRVLVNEGKPQVYGTRFAVDGGQVVPFPMEDAEHVDDRRRAVGLPPMDDYRRRVLSAIAEMRAGGGTASGR